MKKEVDILTEQKMRENNGLLLHYKGLKVSTRIPLNNIVPKLKVTDTNTCNSSEVECQTPSQEIDGWNPTTAILYPRARHMYSLNVQPIPRRVGSVKT